MKDIRQQLSQIDEYTLIKKKTNKSVVRISNDMSSDVIHNISETYIYEIIKDNKRSITKTDSQKLGTSLINAIDKLKYIEKNSMNFAEKTNKINYSYEYGEHVCFEDLEKINNQVFNFVKKVDQLAYINIESSSKYMEEETSNSYGLNLWVKQKSSMMYINIYSNDKRHSIGSHYFKLPNNLDNIQKKIISSLQDVPLKTKAVNILPGIYNIIIKNNLAAEIIRKIVEMAFGEKIISGSWLANKNGHQIICNKINIIEKSSSLNYQRHFDIYGEKVRPKYIVKNGMLQTYLVNRQNARKLGMKSTGHSFLFQEDFVNLYVNYTCSYPCDFTGVLIDEFCSIDSNCFNAKMIVHISGFFVEQGKKMRAFQNGILNLDLVHLTIIEIFDDIYEDGRVFCGSIFLENTYINGH